VATVLGLNPYKKPHQLIAEKIGLPGNEFDGNSATRWGNLFETVTRDFSIKFLKMEHDIIEMGVISQNVRITQRLINSLDKMTREVIS
jgi:predicted phage-related endonuclease